MRAIIQVPVNPALKKRVEKKAESDGFSSVQQLIRLVLAKYDRGSLEVNIQEQLPPVQLSKKAIRRYNKIDRDIASGKIKLKSFDSVDELMKDLAS